MRSWFPPAGGWLGLLLVLALVATGTGRAVGDDRFSVAIGPNEDLMIFGPKGDKVADLPVPSVAQAVVVDSATSFQASYGRDFNGRLSAIFTPNTVQPSDLHFEVMGKTVDTDKIAVVTLTFSPSLNHVSVDPGYIGTVQVNSRTLERHDLNESVGPATSAPETAPAPVAAAPPPMITAPVVRNPPPPSVSAPTPAPAVVTTPAPEPAQPLPVLPSVPAGSKLFWSEPVTGPNGHAPHVDLDGIRLLEVHGTVSVWLPDGTERDGDSGMNVPTGSEIVTGDGSSAAVFFGGVDSVRLLPDSHIGVTQQMEGAVRHVTIELEGGTAFSRVGRRAGEDQRYEVRTPHSLAVARGTEFADTLVDNIHYVFVEKGTVGLYADGEFLRNVSGNGGGDIGLASIPRSSGAEHFLHQILTELQPFNVKTNRVVLRVQQGDASKEEQAYYMSALRGAMPE